MIRNRLEGIVFPIRLVDDIPFKPVVSIAYGAIKKPKEEQVEAAQNLLLHFDQGLLENPQFYQKVRGSGHLRILQLLGTVIPSGQDEIEKFTQGEDHAKILCYFQGIVNNRVRVEYSGSEYKSYNKGDYNDRLASTLRLISGIPHAYLDKIFEQIGLPLPERRDVSDTGSMFEGALKVNNSRRRV